MAWLTLWGIFACFCSFVKLNYAIGSGCFNARLTLECLYSMLDRCVARDKNLLLFCSCFCCRYFLWALNVSTCVLHRMWTTSLKYRTRTHTLVLGHNKSTTIVHNMHRNKNSIYNEPPTHFVRFRKFSPKFWMYITAAAVGNLPNIRLPI